MLPQNDLLPNEAANIALHNEINRLQAWKTGAIAFAENFTQENGYGKKLNPYSDGSLRAEFEEGYDKIRAIIASDVPSTKHANQQSLLEGLGQLFGDK